MIRRPPRSTPNDGRRQRHLTIPCEMCIRDRASARYGMYIGMLLILIQTIQYLAGLYVSFLFSILTGSLFVVGVVMLIRDYRDKDLNGWMSYGQGVSVGSLSSVAGGLIYGAFMLILVT